MSAESPVPDPSLSLPARRLAGSAHCLNCGTPLQGPFCHFCGQPDRNFLRFFPALMREFLSDFLDLDSRFLRTLKPLLFRPGRLTRDYLDGRRFRYVPPVRLYLFSSIAFFLLAALVSSLAMEPGVFRIDGSGSAAGLEGLSEEDRAEVEAALAQLPEGLRDQVRMQGEETTSGPEPLDLQFNDRPWHREDNPLLIPLAPDWLNDWVNDELADSPRKAEEISANPNLIVDQMLDLAPGAVFVLLPVVALLFKLFYLFARRYYVEHLILALHNHAFIFVVLIITVLLGLAEDAFARNGMEFGQQAAGVSMGLAYTWMPVYLLLSLRTVYRQNWFLTLVKGLLIGISYLTLLGVVSGLVALLGFLLL